MRAIRAAAIRNPCIFCRYPPSGWAGSHLHIPQLLKLQSLQQIRAHSSYLFWFLQMQNTGAILIFKSRCVEFARTGLPLALSASLCVLCVSALSSPISCLPRSRVFCVPRRVEGPLPLLHRQDLSSFPSIVCPLRVIPEIPTHAFSYVWKLRRGVAPSSASKDTILELPVCPPLAPTPLLLQSLSGQTMTRSRACLLRAEVYPLAFWRAALTPTHTR